MIFQLRLVLLTFIAFGLSMTTATANNLKQFQNDYRVLLVFTSDTSNTTFIRQKTVTSTNIDGLSDRDILRLHVDISEQSVTPYAPANTKDTINDLPNAQNLLNSYNPDDKSFHVVLIGKDGGVKKEWDKAVSIDELFNIIDAMPMRIQEMKDNP